MIAPATVAPGGALDVVVDPAPNQIPSEVNGNTVKEVHTRRSGRGPTAS